MKAVLVAVCCMLALASAAPKASDAINFFAPLLPVSTCQKQGEGGCGMWYDTSSMMLTLACQYVVPDAVTAAHIHGPNTGGAFNAPPIWTLTPKPDPQAAKTGGGTIMYATTTALTNAQEADLFSGLYYVNVHSTNCTGGNIRGTLANAQAGQIPFPAYTANIENTQVSSPASTSTYVGSAALLGQSGAWTLSLIHNIPFGMDNVTAIHLHGPAAPGSNVPTPVTTICSGVAACMKFWFQPQYAFTALTAADESTLQLSSGMAYINIHTTSYAGGEIRGQLQKVNAQAKPVRGAASSLVVGLPVFIVSLIALLAL
jgi:hypothetical protein